MNAKLLGWDFIENSVFGPKGQRYQLKELSFLVPMRSIFGVRRLDTAFPGGGAALPRAR